MNLLALLLGLAVERLLTALFRVREFHWLDPYIDKFYRTFKHGSRAVNIIAVWLFLLALISPVLLIAMLLEDQFAQIPLFVFSVFVLLFCLGPRDLGEEVSDYLKAIEENDREELMSAAAELLDREPSPSEGIPDIGQAIFVQANNRIFGVVFWFALLGPVGAWIFRVVDLMRHRVFYHPESATIEYSLPLMEALLVWHRVMAWVPSRLLMLGYALAGNFEQAISTWRQHKRGASVVGIDEDLLGSVGSSAANYEEDADVAGRAKVAMDLVIRTLWFIWCPVLALLTLYGALN